MGDAVFQEEYKDNDELKRSLREVFLWEIYLAAYRKKKNPENCKHFNLKPQRDARFSPPSLLHSVKFILEVPFRGTKTAIHAPNTSRISYRYSEYEILRVWHVHARCQVAPQSRRTYTCVVSRLNFNTICIGASRGLFVSYVTWPD